MANPPLPLAAADKKAVIFLALDALGVPDPRENASPNSSGLDGAWAYRKME